MKNDNVASESVQLTTKNMSLKKTHTHTHTTWYVYFTYLVNVRNGNLRVTIPCNLETVCTMHFAYIYNI